MDNKIPQIQNPKSNKIKTFDDEKIKTHQNADAGGWSFLQSLCNSFGTDRNRAGAECADKTYVHPLVRRSLSKLSEKSLEMCTESLGSETGSESGDEISFLSPEATACVVSTSSKPREENFLTNKRNMNRGNRFPPPLKSVSGSNNCHGGVKVRSYRENGRLVLRAVRVSSPVSCFRSERMEGRLRLCFLNHSSPNYENQKNDDDNDDDEPSEGGAEEDIEGNNELVEGKIASEKFVGMNSRCKEGANDQNGLVNWEQFWVAT